MEDLPIVSYSKIQPLVQNEIQEAMKQFASDRKYDVAQIPAHAHTGVDSEPIDFTTLENITNSSYTEKGVVEILTNATTSGLTIASGVLSVNMGTGANQIVQLNGSAQLPAVDGSLLTNLPVASIAPVFTQTSSSTTQNIDTTFTTTFTPKAITIYFVLKGVDSAGTITYTKGNMVYVGTTLRGVFYSSNQHISTYTPTVADIFIGTTAPNSGGFTGGGNSIDVTLTVNSVSSTTLVVRAAYRQNGTGQPGTADFYVIATK